MERLRTKLSDLASKDVQKHRITHDNLKNYGLKDIELRPYQLDGVNWLIERLHRGHGCILGDEMGLGKTCQSISFILYLLGQGRVKSPCLVLAPLSVTANWKTEMTKFAPGLRLVSYLGDKDHREKLRNEINRKTKANSSPFDVLLTTYEVVLKDESYLSKLPWSLLVVDEAHRLKNSQSMLHQALVQFDVEQRVLLTGTPIQNNLTELFSLLTFVAPHLFREKYRQDFLDTFENVEDDSAGTSVSELHSLLQPFLLRRVKNEVVRDLPNKSEIVLYHNLTALQKKYYKAILTKDVEAFESAQTFPGQSKTRLMNVLVQLRKCVNHPYLFDGVEPEPFELGEHLVEASGKLVLIDQLLTFLQLHGHKVLLFSQMTRMLDIIQDYLGYRGFNYERLDGSVRGEERFLAIQNFNEQEDNFVFLLSTKAGGQGLNLTAADTVIFVDSDFNPQNDLQAAARAHRIGQTRPVRILRLIGRSTVEEIILRRAEAKLRLTNAVVEGGQFSLGESKESIIADNNLQLQDILKFGLDRLFESEDSAKDAVDFEQILGASVDGQWQLSETQGEATQSQDAEVENGEAGPSTMYEFEGTDYSKETSAEDKTVFDALIAAEKAIQEAASSTSHGDRTRRRQTVTLLQGLPEVNRKPRAKLTPEQLEERRKKRQEAAERRAQLEEEEEVLRAQKERKRRESLWSKNGYVSCNITVDSDEEEESEDEEQSDGVGIDYVSGDVTRPVNTRSANSIIIHCADDSGRWGTGGVFSAIDIRSPHPEAQYELAAKMKDLALGDAHLIDIDDVQTGEKGNDYLALLIVQHRDHHNRLSGIKLTALSEALARVCKAAKQKKASVHLPRIGYKTPGFNWYGTERLIRKHLSSRGIPTYIYYYPRNQRLKRRGSSPPSSSKVRRKASVDASTSGRGGSPAMLTDIFTGLSVYLHGLSEDETRRLRRYIVAYDGDVDSVLKPSTTHVVTAAQSEMDKQELRKLIGENSVVVVCVKWVDDCLRKAHKQGETPYKIDC